MPARGAHTDRLPTLAAHGGLDPSPTALRRADPVDFVAKFGHHSGGVAGADGVSVGDGQAPQAEGAWASPVAVAVKSLLVV